MSAKPGTSSPGIAFLAFGALLVLGGWLLARSDDRR
jgi:hypothetical protein